MGGEINFPRKCERGKIEENSSIRFDSIRFDSIRFAGEKFTEHRGGEMDRWKIGGKTGFPKNFRIAAI